MALWLTLPANRCRGLKTKRTEKVAVKPEKLAKDAEFALASLYEKAPATKILAENAQAILVFPKITRASVGVGSNAAPAHC